MTCRFLLLLMSTMICSFVLAQNFNRPVPPGIFPYEYKEYLSGINGYYFITPFHIFKNKSHPDHIPAKPMLLDKDGFLIWYAEANNSYGHFRYFPGFNKFGFESSYTQGVTYYKILDQDFKIIDSFTNSAGIYSDTHEFLMLRNGNYLISGAKDSIVDLSGHIIGGVSGSNQTTIVGYTIEEFDASHNLVFYWNSNDHIDPLDSYIENYGGYDSTKFDYCHGNSIDEDIDGNFLVSFRHTNSIVKIDRNTGNVLWILGGRSNQFTFINDQGFSGQHDARRLNNGNISLYDNGNMKVGIKESRAVEYALDTLNMTASLVWEYKYSPPFYSFAMGNHQTTPDGFHLINYGISFRPNPSISVVDYNNNLYADIFLKDSIMNYRAFYYELPFTLDRPKVQCAVQNSTQTLTAPPGYDKYIWSTGETSSSINVTSPGLYQVWVNKGIGMIGSEPILINNIGEQCIVLGVQEKNINEGVDIVEIYDLIGRRVTNPQANTIYLIRYANGKIKKVLWSDLKY